MATHQECIHSKLCTFRKDLCVTENLQNVEKECPFFEEKKCGQWEDNGRCSQYKIHYKVKFYRTNSHF